MLSVKPLQWVQVYCLCRYELYFVLLPQLDIEKLEEMIQNLKEEIRRDDSTVKKDLLINYQIRLQQLKEVSGFH